jgi:hypothetical protein
MKTLDNIMTETGSDKASWAHNYCPFYEQYIGHLRDEEIVLLELGIGGEDKELGGASLKGWAQYYPSALICGVDIYDKSELNSSNICIYQGSQDDPIFLQSVIDEIGQPYIIIDDASHICNLTIESFKILFPKLKSGGYYIIEDISTSYRWDFGGNTSLNNMMLPTTMNYLFNMLHSLNPIEHVADASYQRPEEYKEVESVSFYPDIVIIKKK